LGNESQVLAAPVLIQGGFLQRPADNFHAAQIGSTDKSRPCKAFGAGDFQEKKVKFLAVLALLSSTPAFAVSAVFLPDNPEVIAGIGHAYSQNQRPQGLNLGEEQRMAESVGIPYMLATNFDRLRGRLSVASQKALLVTIGQMTSAALMHQAVNFVQKGNLRPGVLEGLERDYALLVYRDTTAHQLPESIGTLVRVAAEGSELSSTASMALDGVVETLKTVALEQGELKVQTGAYTDHIGQAIGDLRMIGTPAAIAALDSIIHSEPGRREDTSGFRLTYARQEIAKSNAIDALAALARKRSPDGFAKACVELLK
jgi:hypothetical protein